MFFSFSTPLASVCVDAGCVETEQNSCGTTRAGTLRLCSFVFFVAVRNSVPPLNNQ